MFPIKATSAELAYYDSLSVVQKLAKERHPDWGLAIDHKGEATNVGKGLLQISAQSRFNIASLSSNPDQVTRQLKHIGSGFNSSAIALFAYSLHHFSENEIKESLAALRNATHGGAVVAIDYALDGIPSERAEDAVSSTTELKQVQSYGDFESWLEQHNPFTNHSIADLMQDVGYNNVTSKEVQVGRTITIGLQDNNTDTQRILDCLDN